MSKLIDNFEKSSAEIKGKELEAARQNYYIAAKMSGSDDRSIAGLNISASGRKNTTLIDQKKTKQSTTDFLMMLDIQLAAIENAMIDKYGEDFAENLAAEYLDEETYKALMQIEDPEERRKAIAKVLNDGIKDGTIDSDEVNKNPDVKDWLDKHAERDGYEAKNAVHGQAHNHDLTTDNSEETKLNNLFGTGVNLS